LSWQILEEIAGLSPFNLGSKRRCAFSDFRLALHDRVLRILRGFNPIGTSFGSIGRSSGDLPPRQ
jgi:hypothetical protein